MQSGLPFRILVVEDDEDDRLLINEAFGEIGYGSEVKKFKDGQALLHYLSQMEPVLLPSLIVLDNSLPGLDAIDLLRLLKSDQRYKDIRVVIYTTLLTPVKDEQLRKAGAYLCLEKGTTMQEIIQVANRLREIAVNE
jgi:CheY-like chemotaxis protein